MSWLHQGTRSCHPEHYTDAADRAEAVLRADFASRHFLLEIAPYAADAAGQMDFLTRAHEIERRWADHPAQQTRQLWGELNLLRNQWMSDPATLQSRFGHLQRSRAAGVESVDDLADRNWRQMAELTGTVEPVNTASEQDAAAFRAQGRHLVLIRSTDTSTEANAAARPGAADRALGGRAAEELDMARIGDLIDFTHDLATEPTDPAPAPEPAPPITLDALIPAAQREAVVVADLSATQEQVLRQVAPVRALQDLYAEHLRLSETFDRTHEGGQALIDRLEGVLTAARTARQQAVTAGVSPADIDAAYRAGLEGQYWSQQPGVPHLALVEQLVTQRDHAHAQLDQLRAGLGHEPGAVLALAVGAEHSTPSTEPAAASGSGGVISSAVEAALPDLKATEHAAWMSPEVTGVIEFRPDPAAEPHL
ncbi:hypothetical protein [Nocardia thailandica]|uniref:hypothetical protein n=1 Tax=Nocardia thailandica TaxID=257275 RepID=UPI00030F6713|nr:hypothetical protein [Nocardia thailandica]